MRYLYIITYILVFISLLHVYLYIINKCFFFNNLCIIFVVTILTPSNTFVHLYPRDTVWCRKCGFGSPWTDLWLRTHASLVPRRLWDWFPAGMRNVPATFAISIGILTSQICYNALYTTSPLSPDIPQVPYPLIHHKPLMPWHTTSPLSPDKPQVPYPLTYHKSLIPWHNHKSLSPWHNHKSLIPWHTKSPLSPTYHKSLIPLHNHKSLIPWHTINHLCLGTPHIPYRWHTICPISP